MEVTLSPITDQKGDISHLVKSTRDITDLIEVEKALQDSEEKYRSLFELANDSIFIIDPSTRRFLDVNKNASGLLGYSREEFLQLSLDDIYTPLAAKRNDAIIRKLIDTGSVVFEHVQLHKGGTEIPAEVSSRVIEYSGQKVIQSIVRDIRERRRAEETLRIERGKAQKYLDIAGVMFIIIGADQRVEMINKKGCHVLGFKEKDIIGQNWFDAFVPESVRQQLKTEFSRLLTGEIEPIDYFENPVLTKWGEERTAELLRSNKRLTYSTRSTTW